MRRKNSRKRGEARSFHAGGGRGTSGIRIVYIAALTLLTGIHFAHRITFYSLQYYRKGATQ